MSRLDISRRAVADLEAIRLEGELEFGAVATTRHFRRIDEAFALLERFPFAGQARPEYGEQIRSLVCRPHRILYRAIDEAVLIVRVVHARQDAHASLTEEA